MLLTSLAGYAAIAIENAALYQRAQSEINGRRRIEDALRESEERYALAVRGSKDGLWDWDLRQNRLVYSPRWKAMLGFSEEEIRPHPDEWFRRVHPEDLINLQLGVNNHLSNKAPYLESEYRIRHKDGGYRWMLCRGQAVWDDNGKASRIAGSQTEITDRKAAEARLIHYAYYDELTGLPNRALFLDRLTMAISRAGRNPTFKYAVLFLDLDHFKDVNDTLGHLVGDQLLIEVGKLLQKRMRAVDTVARLGGDEFVILLEEIKVSDAATEVATWILKALADPFQMKGHEIYISASIGVVLSETGYDQPDEILRDADIAMYHAKSQGKSRFEVFDPTLRYRILERHELIADLRRAIEHDELRVFYQVISSLKSGEVNGVEALVRWEHPVRGLMLPMDFIPLAEETGLIIAIDRWVLRQACNQLRRWQAEFATLDHLTISVNMSSRQMVQSDLVDFVASVLAETRTPASNLNLEVTENVIVENREITIEVSNRLRALGVQIHIDDFGIGYSSLGYISHLPVNALKIDRSFIHNMNEDDHEMSIVHTILTLSSKLGVDAIAEGVETEKHLVKLAELGCDFAQGFYLSPPLPADALHSLLARAAAPPIKPDQAVLG
jgi:diguanylate cyclase (GGDEF)-like protein/PAS domain S-box-containing protein